MQAWDRLTIIDGGDSVYVAPQDDPDDWIVCFAKAPAFPAHAWAERMVQFYNRAEDHAQRAPTDSSGLSLAYFSP
jgi:hypothetical protein